MARAALIRYDSYNNDGRLIGRGYTTFPFQGNFTNNLFKEAMIETTRNVRENNSDVSLVTPEYIFLFESEEEKGS